MNCPFCLKQLINYADGIETTYACRELTCLFLDMPRFQEIHYQGNLLLIRKLMIGEFYIQIDYVGKTTTISKLQACLLMDTFQIPHVLDIDMQDPNSAIPKIKLLALFS